MARGVGERETRPLSLLVRFRDGPIALDFAEASPAAAHARLFRQASSAQLEGALLATR